MLWNLPQHPRVRHVRDRLNITAPRHSHDLRSLIKDYIEPSLLEREQSRGHIRRRQVVKHECTIILGIRKTRQRVHDRSRTFVIAVNEEKTPFAPELRRQFVDTFRTPTTSQIRSHATARQ